MPSTKVLALRELKVSNSLPLQSIEDERIVHYSKTSYLQTSKGQFINVGEKLNGRTAKRIRKKARRINDNSKVTISNPTLELQEGSGA
jgi:hypothetical protein